MEAVGGNEMERENAADKVRQMHILLCNSALVRNSELNFMRTECEQANERATWVVRKVIEHSKRNEMRLGLPDW